VTRIWLRADRGLEGIQGGDQIVVDPDDEIEIVLYRPACWSDSETDRVREVLRKAFLAGYMTNLTPDVDEAEVLKMLGSTVEPPTLRLVK
jgi:hypothetical protein